jgi:hypothetical protein
MTIGRILAATVVANHLASWASMRMRHVNALKQHKTHSRSPPQRQPLANVKAQPPPQAVQGHEKRVTAFQVYRIASSCVALR